MRFHYYTYFFILILFSVPVIAQDYLALQGSASGSGGGTGSIVVEIWSAATGGSMLYNSSNDFNGVISSSRYDILLGNGTNPLSLNFSGTYYMEMYINGRDIDFNTSERQVFQSPVGNITVDDPIKTTKSLNVNDFFNVTETTSAVRTNGTVTILNTDTDDALNVSGGIFSDGQFKTDGTYVSTAAATTLALDIGGSATIANFFNITPATSAVRTNGTITIESVVAPAFTVNNGFNVSGASGVLNTNSTIAIGTRRANALTIGSGFNVTGPAGTLVTNGTVSIQNPSLTPAFTVNNGFNISGTDEAVKTNGTITILNTDTDDALNISGGLKMGAEAGSTFTLASFTISDQGVITTDPTIGPAAGRGNIVINSLTAEALSINSGFNVSGPTLAMRTNGTVTILNTDTDDALNISGGLKMGAQIGSTFTFSSFTISDQGVITTDPTIGPVAGRGNIVIRSLTAQALSINSGFNVSGPTLEMRTNGTVTITNNDVDDALNVTGSIAQQGATITIGNAESTTQHGLEAYDGGVNKCAYLRMFDDTGADWFLFANSTGHLRIFADKPTGAGQCNTGGGGVGGQPNP